MVDSIRKKSPRAPSLALDEALDRAIRAYEKERLHPAPTDVVAQNIGYKGANGGAALSALASLRYYGLLERPREGFLAVSKDVESFRYAPTEELRKSLLVSFIKRPPLYAELLDKYATGLPSDANLKFELINQRGFIPGTVDSVLAAFKKSIDFVGYFEASNSSNNIQPLEELSPSPVNQEERNSSSLNAMSTTTSSLSNIAQNNTSDDDLDRIPVRLHGGRRAWLLIPAPFYNADKARLKAQIDLLLTEDEETT